MIIQVSSSLNGTVDRIIVSNSLDSVRVINAGATSIYASSSGIANTASFAVTSAYALSSAGTITSAVSATLAQTASFVFWDNVINKPIGIVSSSIQYSTGSFSGSFKGDGSQLYSISTASYAVTSSYAANVAAADWNTLANKPAGIISSSAQLPSGLISSSAQLPNGLVSSSVQINTGSFSGSFVGSGGGLHSIVSSAFAGTDWSVINNKPVGLVTSSVQINTGSYTGSFKGDGSLLHSIPSASFAGTDWLVVNNKPINLVSSSIQVATGSYTGSFKGDGSLLHSIPSASYAITASYVAGAAVDWATLSNKPTGLVSSSAQLPSGLVSSSIQINTGSYTGSFKGDGSLLHSIPSASYAITASYALDTRYGKDIELVIVSAIPQYIIDPVPSAGTEQDIFSRKRFNFYTYREAQLRVNVITSASAGLIGAEYSVNNGSTWIDFATSCSLTTTGSLSSSWVALPSLTQDTLIRWVALSGSGAESVKVNSIILGVR